MAVGASGNAKGSPKHITLVSTLEPPNYSNQIKKIQKKTLKNLCWRKFNSWESETWKKVHASTCSRSVWQILETLEYGISILKNKTHFLYFVIQLKEWSNIFKKHEIDLYLFEGIPIPHPPPHPLLAYTHSPTYSNLFAGQVSISQEGGSCVGGWGNWTKETGRNGRPVVLCLIIKRPSENPLGKPS